MPSRLLAGIEHPRQAKLLTSIGITLQIYPMFLGAFSGKMPAGILKNGDKLLNIALTGYVSSVDPPDLTFRLQSPTLDRHGYANSDSGRWFWRCLYRASSSATFQEGFDDRNHAGGSGQLLLDDPPAVRSGIGHY